VLARNGRIGICGSPQSGLRLPTHFLRRKIVGKLVTRFRSPVANYLPSFLKVPSPTFPHHSREPRNNSGHLAAFDLFAPVFLHITTLLHITCTRFSSSIVDSYLIASLQLTSNLPEYPYSSHKMAHQNPRSPPKMPVRRTRAADSSTSPPPTSTNSSGQSTPNLSGQQAIPSISQVSNRPNVSSLLARSVQTTNQRESSSTTKQKNKTEPQEERKEDLDIGVMIQTAIVTYEVEDDWMLLDEYDFVHHTKAGKVGNGKTKTSKDLADG
jgi:hypothetical protein